MTGATEDVYDASCDHYDGAHARWLRHAGGEAQCAFEGAVTALLSPGMAVLDAACGTGTVARRLLRTVGGHLDLVLLDASENMLGKCRDIAARRILGRIEHLPFDADQFDLVTCAWGLETLNHPEDALSEFLRITRPGGHICIVFCADRPSRSLIASGLRHSIVARGRGRFLDHADIRAAAIRLGAKSVRPVHCTGPASTMILYV